MALAQYSDTFWFPSGSLASSVPAAVFLKNTNVLAQLWADAAGTLALPNPLNTSASGVLAFYATVGEYWIHIDTETFLVDVGMSQEQADLSTGLASGGNVVRNAVNLKSIDISPFIAYIVDNTSETPVSPSVTRIDYPGATVQLDGPAQGRSITWWLMDATQTIIQQAGTPTNEQRRTHLIITQTSYDIASGVIFDVNPLPVGLPQLANQLGDLMEGIRPFSASGNIVNSNGPNLTISKTSGTVFQRSVGYFAGGVATNNPHVNPTAAQAPITFRRILQIPTVPTPPLVTTVDPANYDVGGVLTPVPGGSNTSTVQRVWLFASDNVAAQVLVQYGQATFSSLTTAVNAIGSGIYVPTPLAPFGTLICWIAMIKSATDLSDPAQAVFVNAPKFAVP